MINARDKSSVLVLHVVLYAIHRINKDSNNMALCHWATLHAPIVGSFLIPALPVLKSAHPVALHTNKRQADSAVLHPVCESCVRPAHFNTR